MFNGIFTKQFLVNFRYTNLSLAIVFALLTSNSVKARDYFNPELIESGENEVNNMDLSLFEAGNQVPGRYRVDINVNNIRIQTADINFYADPEVKGGLSPCLSKEQLKVWGVNDTVLQSIEQSNQECIDLNAIPQAFSTFQFNEQKLNISIPQAYLNQSARGYTPPELWDEGITAFLMNYSFTGAENHSQSGGKRSNQFLNFRPGINLGGWRLRNYSTWSNTDGKREYKSIYNYLKRDIVPAKGQLILGDSTTSSEIFDSVPFRGMQLASDDEMLPDSLKGYAPVVRGIAYSNAKVSIRQNGYEIYQSYVSPGAFEISDMYPTGGSGDLLVNVQETDGSEHSFSVPFASLPLLQREGHLKYSITAGEYRSYSKEINNSNIAQSTLIYGLPSDMTMYGGFQVAKKYDSLSLGIGKNMGNIGAFSVDVTHAISEPDNEDKKTGQSWRARYSKNIIKSGTNFSIAAYRYSTSGFYNLQEVLDTYSSKNEGLNIERRRNRAEATLNQSLWEKGGTVSLNLVSEDYWTNKRRTKSVNLSYNNSWRNISYNLSWSYNKESGINGGGNKNATSDNQAFSFNISMPLGLSNKDINVNYSLDTASQGSINNSVGLSGVALEGRNLDWSINESIVNGNKSSSGNNSGSMNMSYKGTYGETNAGYGYNHDERRVNYGLQGGVLIHRYGVTLSQPLGETVALVEAKGAADIGIRNQTGVRTDYRGYAVVPYVSPYRKNNITLNTESIPENIDITQSSNTVYPTRGAVVRTEFLPYIGSRVLMTLVRSATSKVPFGATVSDMNASGNRSFIVGDDGSVYISGLANSGKLLVQWGKDVSKKCQVSYSLPEGSSSSDIVEITEICR